MQYVYILVGFIDYSGLFKYSLSPFEIITFNFVLLVNCLYIISKII